jgi:diadenylate cyclase
MLVDTGFLSIRFWDIADILIVGYLMFQIYKLLRGSVAFNIFVGVILLYAFSWLVRALKMELLSIILGQFVSVGVIVIAIVFQPEIRRFLLVLGNNTLKSRFNFLHRFTKTSELQTAAISSELEELKLAIQILSEQKTGALIVLANNLSLTQFSNSGVVMDAVLTKALLLSIFNKESPLHDGAVIITDNKIHAASCILPVSDNPEIPQAMGLRHRAAVGITESVNVTAIIVSEETGKIAFANRGRLHGDLSNELFDSLLREYYN